MWGKIKIDAADKKFSEYIRQRDGRCVACGRLGTGEKGIVGLDNSHYFSRRNESTRFDPRNCDALCRRCHQRWGGDYRDEYKAFKIKQLGFKEYQLLDILAHSYKKRDRKLELIKAKMLLDTL